MLNIKIAVVNFALNTKAVFSCLASLHPRSGLLTHTCVYSSACTRGWVNNIEYFVRYLLLYMVGGGNHNLNEEFRVVVSSYVGRYSLWLFCEFFILAAFFGRR